MIAMRIKITTPVVMPKMIAIRDVSDNAPGRLLFVDDTVPGRLLFVDDTVPVLFPEKVTIHSSVVSLKNRLSPILIYMKKYVYII